MKVASEARGVGLKGSWFGNNKGFKAGVAGSESLVAHMRMQPPVLGILFWRVPSTPIR